MASYVENVSPDNVSTEHSPTESDATAVKDEPCDILLTTDFVEEVDRKQLDVYERISISFLFFDNPDASLEKCSNILSNRNFRFISNYISANPPECWSMKFIECIYRVKNFYVLDRIGLDKHDGKRTFTQSSRLLPDRIILFEICESLSEFEKSCIINSVHGESEEYLEVFFLKTKKKYEWDKIWTALEQLHNDQISALLNKWKANNIENSLIRCFSEEESLPAPKSHKLYSRKVYPIKDPENVGFCLIINNMEVKGEPPRQGSDRDVALLERTFKHFKFSVTTVRNVQGSFFSDDLLMIISKNFNRNHSIFAFIIMSHGSEGKFCCTDGHLVSIDEDILQILNKAPELKNIPKILIVQACQGNKFLRGSAVEADGPSADNNATGINTNAGARVNNAAARQNFIIGEHISDIVILMSTVNGFKSFRHRQSGAIFIQILCECFIELQYAEILEIMTEVISRVTTLLIPVDEDNFVMQHPTSRSLLKKKLYLKAKKDSV